MTGDRRIRVLRMMVHLGMMDRNAGKRLGFARIDQFFWPPQCVIRHYLQKTVRSTMRW
jgi:hypothetical protein